MARKFLYIVAALLVLFVIGRIALTFFAEDLTELTFVPGGAYEKQEPLPAKAWDKPEMWIAGPIAASGHDSGQDKDWQDPASWLPADATRPPEGAARAAVFFVHPTSFLDKSSWNAPLDNAEANERADLFTQAMASAFSSAGTVWAPRYRQATFGAFLSDRPDAKAALDLAYGDVGQAFATFLARNPQGPILIVGHSQGAYLLRQLLRDHVAGTPLTQRIAAVYLPGWPVSLKHDLPAMGLPTCSSEDQSGCVLSWLSVADPADTAMLLKGYARRPGLDGQPLAGSAFLCTNPLTGSQDGQSDAAINLGTLVPDFEKRTGTLVAKTVPAACGTDGFLHIGPAPKLEMGDYVLPGNNYHVYDIALFWANLRADARKRLTAWTAEQERAPPTALETGQETAKP